MCLILLEILQLLWRGEGPLHWLSLRELFPVADVGCDAMCDGCRENWWALVALALVAATAAGNILVCLAIYWERRLQNVTNYFLMSLAITDLMVAVLVMPLGILTLVRGNPLYLHPQSPIL